VTSGPRASFFFLIKLFIDWMTHVGLVGLLLQRGLDVLALGLRERRRDATVSPRFIELALIDRLYPHIVLAHT
jgi:hypothetical protein